MSKIITEKMRAVYDFLNEKNREYVKNNIAVPPTCYALSVDNKNEISVLPIPLKDLQDSNDRIFLLKEMGKILKKEKVKIKMFIIVCEAWMSKVDRDKNPELLNVAPSLDPNRTEALIISARDCYDFTRYEAYEIKKNKEKIELEMVSDIIKEGRNEWRREEGKEGKLLIQDNLLDAIWSEYRKLD